MPETQQAVFGTTIRTITKVGDHIRPLTWYVASNTPSYQQLLRQEIEGEDESGRFATLYPIEFLEIHESE